MSCSLWVKWELGSSGFSPSLSEIRWWYVFLFLLYFFLAYALTGVLNFLSEMGSLDVLKLDCDSDLEVDAKQVGPSEEEMADLHAKTVYARQDYMSIFPTKDLSSYATPLARSPERAIAKTKLQRNQKLLIM
jgi:hypothetical protein